MNNKGNAGELMMGILWAFLAVTFAITLLPGFLEIVGFGQGSNSLNCHGYVNYSDSSLSANDSRPEASTVGCLALKLYVPYFLLGVLIAVVGIIFYGKYGSSAQQQMPYYGG